MNRPAFFRNEIIMRIFPLFFFFISANSAEIEDISFQQKGYIFPEEMIRYNLQSVKGGSFEQKILDEDVKRLYSTGNFLDIVAEASQTPDGKVNIILKLASKPRIKSVVLRGNKKYSEDDLKDKITIQPNTPLNDQVLQQTLSNIRKFYADKGYNSAVITHSTEEAGDGNINAAINIAENLRLKVLSVSFTGNTLYSSWTLRGTVATQHSYLSWILNTGLYDANEVENDKQRLRDLYWNKGCLDFRVKSVDVKEDENPEYVSVTFNLEEGEPYGISEVSISGNKKFSADELLPLLSLKTDDVYDNRSEKKDIDTIGNKYHPLGYADFYCKPVRFPDVNTHTVNIEYRISEGEQFTVREVNISGNYNTKDKVIRRELAFQPGDPVDKMRIDASKSRLMGMDYFEKVGIVSVNTEEQGKKDIEINVAEKDTAKFAVGGGFSDTDSAVGMVELTQTNFDLLDPWNYFVGGGQRLKLQAEYGTLLNNFALSFTEPWLFDLPLRLDLAGFYHTRDYKDWDERYIGGSTSLTRRLFDDFTSISLGYTLQQVRISNIDDDMSEIFQKEEGKDMISKWSMTLARDTRDNLADPTSGYLLSALGEVNAKAMGGSVNYCRVEGTASNYYPFFDNMFILHAGLKLGQVDRFGSGRLTPIYERYFLGGGDTVRGFPFRKISPLDGNDDAYGGESMLLGNIEVTHPIYEFIRGAVFLDAGDVWRKAWSMNVSDINAGAGYGLRIKLPYINAPVKLDLAYPIVKEQDDVRRKFRFHFNLGFTWSP